MCMFVFFFKQKTAYELRISDWSSDVCSSDLDALRAAFKELLTDKAFIAEAAKRRLQVNYASGAEVEKMISAAMDTLDAKELTEIGRASCRERVCPYV